MQLKGWVRTSLIDYPDHIATVLFTGGCNFRCPMCHNADLVLRPETLPDISVAEVLAYLEQRAGRLTGVVLTGGEPTLQNNLAEFLGDVRALGYAVKLDTNGYRPDVLAALLRRRLIDYVAMDVKAPPEKYAEIAGVPSLAIDRIARSLDALRDGDVVYEVRTTVVPWLTTDDVAALAQWLAARFPPHGPQRWVLQPFQAQHTLDARLRDAIPYTPAQLHALAARTRRWVQTVSVR
ncbi:MAG: anaerobic ribonucleoside-triphosphate reductase activating protein [Anaerolineae bacterium]|nr:anaerobic ribonucleoside-triphosphate reductase activating protein [Anaerolineae bacterium]